MRAPPAAPHCAPRTHHPRTHHLSFPFCCADWDSDVNPLAAPYKQRVELLKLGPYCINEGNQVSYCSPNASRTQRSGVTDVEYMLRPDRRYWFLESNRTTYTHTYTDRLFDYATVARSSLFRFLCTFPCLLAASSNLRAIGSRPNRAWTSRSVAPTSPRASRNAT